MSSSSCEEDYDPPQEYIKRKKDCNQNSFHNDEKSHSGLPKVLETDMCKLENTSIHHTDRYSNVNTLPNQLVIRRGEPFKIKITFDKKFDRKKFNLFLIFETSRNPLISDDTQITVICSWEKFSSENDWGAVIKPASDHEFTLIITTPSFCIVGLWNLHIHISFKLDKNRLKSKSCDSYFTCADEILLYILFNPWCKADMVYIREENMRVENVLNDWGKIWRGTISRKTPLMWNYGQFDNHILDASFHLLNLSGCNPTLHGDAVQVVKAVAKQIVSRSGNKTILRSKTQSDKFNVPPPLLNYLPTDALSAVDWQGSPSILEEWYKNHHHFSYSRSWFVAALLTTVLRALGIPCRPVTGYNVSNSVGSSVNIHVDGDGRYITQMNSSLLYVYHVWIEFWTKRVEFTSQYGGWQLVDASTHPVLGPVSLHALREVEVGRQYDTGKIFLSLNADIVYWLHDTPIAQCCIISVQESNTGLAISTRRCGRALTGNMDREDISSSYRGIHWKDDDKDKIMNSLHLSRSSRHVQKYKITRKQNEDKEVTLRIDMGYSIIGQTLLINFFVKNNCEEHQTLTIKSRVHSVNQIGLIGYRIKKANICVDLSPHQESIVSVKIEPSEYVDKLVDKEGLIKISALYRSNENGRTGFTEQDMLISSPEIHISVVPPVVVGRPIKVRAHLMNPLSEELTCCKFILEGPGFERSRHMSISSVPVKGSAEFWWVTIPRRVGDCCLLATFTSHQLKDVHGYLCVNVLPSEN